jgi:aldehyde:ferredoxin oxidoreductase
MLDEYYISRGWDAGGRPSAAKLARLDLAATALATGGHP